MEDKGRYVLITPVKDEYQSLLPLIRTVEGQSRRPVLWVLVDGQSKDGSYEWLLEASRRLPWIIVIRQHTFFESGYSHRNLAQAVNEGIICADSECSRLELSYNYIGKLDATVELEPGYYLSLIQKMDADASIAISSGIQKSNDGETDLAQRWLPGDVLSRINDNRLYRKSFIKKVGGYPLTFSPDTILVIRARSNGQKVEVVNGTSLRDTRKGGTKVGVWRGFILKGRSMWALGYSPLIMALNALYYVFDKPRYQGLAIAMGYMKAMVNKEPKLDEEITVYFSKKRLPEIIMFFLKRHSNGHMGEK